MGQPAPALQKDGKRGAHNSCDDMPRSSVPGRGQSQGQAPAGRERPGIAGAEGRAKRIRAGGEEGYPAAKPEKKFGLDWGSGAPSPSAWG